MLLGLRVLQDLLIEKKVQHRRSPRQAVSPTQAPMASRKMCLNTGTFNLYFRRRGATLLVTRMHSRGFSDSSSSGRKLLRLRFI